MTTRKILAVSAATLVGAVTASGAVNVDADTVLYVTCDADYSFGVNAATAADRFTSTYRNNDFLLTEGRVADAVRDGLDGVDTANGGYLYNKDGEPSPAVEWQGASGYCAGDFTFECFIRIDADKGVSGLSGNYIVYHPKAWMIQFDSTGRPILKAGGWTNLVSAPTINDGVWHHLAVVQDRARGTFAYYLDYRLVGTADYVVSPPTDTASYDFFRISNFERSGQYNFNCVPKGVAYDEVRLTKRALTPSEFLTTPAFAETVRARMRKLEAVTSDATLVYASCDAALLSDNVNDLCNGTTDKPTLVLRMNSGASPAVGATDKLPQVYPTSVLDAEGQTNPGSLELVANGRLILNDTSYLADDFTLEFFFLCADASQMGTGSNDPDGYLVHQNNLFYMRMQNDGRVSCSEEYVPGLADGAWHHYAIVYAKDTRVLRYYIDQRLVKELSFEKDLTELKSDDPLYLGAGSWGNGAWHCVKGCAYDEIRLTRKALRATEFLSAQRFPVFAETRAYLNFDDTLDPSAVRPPLELGCTKWTAKTFEQTTADVPTAFFPTARSAEATANVGALLCDIGQENNGSVAGGYVFDDPDYAFSTGSFTAETYFKVEGQTTYYGYLFNCPNAWSVFLTNLGQNRLGCSAGDFGSVLGDQDLADGRWHHVAVVCDQSMRTLSVYLDHALFHRFTDVENPLRTGATRPDRLYYGCGKSMSYGVGGGLSRGFFDELRLTKRALKVTEFVNTTALSVDAPRLDVRFDDGWNSATTAVLAPVGVPSETGVERIRRGRVSRAILDADGQELRAPNRLGAALTGGTVAYAGNGVLDEPSATFEAFVKRTGGAANDSVLAFTRGTDATAAFWRLAADGSFTVAGAEAFPSVAFDDDWHHVAVSHETTDAGVTVTLWWDHQVVAARTVASAFDFGSGAGLVLGSSGFTGFVDEVRVSVGVLGARDHLYAAPRTGGLVIIR